METLEVVLVNVGLVILLAFIVETLVEHLVGKPMEVAALVGRILTAILVGGGSPVVHAVVKKARDPLAGVLEV